MANWDNQHTRTEQERTRGNLETGIVEGDQAMGQAAPVPVDAAGVDAGLEWVGYPLPSVCYKPFYLCTAYERGFLLGAMLQAWLKDELKGEAS